MVEIGDNGDLCIGMYTGFFVENFGCHENQLL